MIDKIIFMFILFATNIVQTVTGFAGNLIAMPLSLKIIGVGSAKSVINIFTLVACLYISIKNRKNIRWEILTRILFGMIIGMIIGIWAFNYFSFNILIKIYGILILAIAIKKIFIKHEIKLPEPAMMIIILMAGIIHGMFLSGGALLIIYAVGVLKDKNEFRATIAPVWVVLDCLLIYSHYKIGYYSNQNLILILYSMIPLAFSIWLGNILFKKINMNAFIKLTYVLLIVSGISIIV